MKILEIPFKADREAVNTQSVYFQCIFIRMSYEMGGIR